MAKFLFALVGLLFLIHTAHTEPSQYCNFMSGQDEPGANDFCMAVSTYQNQSSNLHDLHITLNVYRPQHNALGWTAIGIGSGMAQSLDFIVYGDPENRVGPVLTVRRSNGHWEPDMFDSATNKGSIRVELLEATWNSSPLGSSSKAPVMAAQMSFICYSCDSGLDPDLEPLASVSTPFQPWIWAKNSEQRLPEYSEATTLETHSLKTGYGSFSVDMTRNIAPVDEAPSSPTIRPGINAIGASETNGQSASSKRPGFSPSPHTIKAAVHGFLMALAFLLLLPCGVLAISSGHPKAFRYHWIVQTAAMACISVGLVLGLLLRSRLDTTHQKLGLATVVAIGLQAALGLCHHIQFLRVPRRTWISHTHIHLGGVTLLAGYCSALTGLILHDSPVFQYAIIGILALAEVVWILVAKFRTCQKPAWEAEKDGSGQSDTYQLLKEEDE